MSSKEKIVYEFGPFRLEPSEYRLLCDGQAVPLTPKAFETLLLLIENAGRVVEKDDLMRRVWPDTIVEESTIAQNIFTLRKVLGVDVNGSSYIETVPKHGYRLGVSVRESSEESPTEPLSTPEPAQPIGRSVGIPAAARRGLAIAGALFVLVAVLAPLYVRYSEQAEQAGLARARLAALRPSGGVSVPSGGQVAVRRLLTVGGYFGLSGSSVSPDGRYLAYTDWTTGDLAVLDLVTAGSRRVTNKGPFSKVVEFAEFFMRFSSDGKQLAYVWAKNGYTLRVINVDGSGSRLIHPGAASGQEVYAYDWSADGKYIAALLPKGGRTTTPRGTVQMTLIRVIDGSVRGLKDLDGRRPPRKMSFSPDGRFLAYDLPVNGELQKRDIFVLDIDGGQEMPAAAHPADDRLLDWTPDGAALLFTSDRAGSLGAWLQPLEDGKPRGEAQHVKDSMGEDIRPLGFAQDGSYYYATSSAGQREVYTASVDLQQGIVMDSPAPAPQVLGSNEGPEWSPDGKSLAYIHNGNTIVIRSLETGTERTLTTMEGIFTIGWGERYLRWSPDGQQLLLNQRRRLLRVDVTTGEATPIVTEGRSRYGRWSRDGKGVFYARLLDGNDAEIQIVRLNLETQEKEVLYTSESAGETLQSLELSPDGRWLAFSDAALEETSGDEETVLMVMPAEGGQPRLLLKVSGSEWVKVVGWTPDAQEILFARDLKLATRHSTTLWRIGTAGGAPRKLELGMNVLNDIRFQPGGRRVAFDSGQRGAEIWVMENFLPPAKAIK